MIWWKNFWKVRFIDKVQRQLSSERFFENFYLWLCHVEGVAVGYVRCSVLQCVAVCCSVLQWVAVGCSVLQCVEVYCSVLQYVTCVAMRCSVLQCVVVCCSVLQCVAVRCSVLQCVAVCCVRCGVFRVLQCVQVNLYCNTL